MKVSNKMAEEKKQPVFSKVAELRPGNYGLNLTVKVVSTKVVAQRGQGRQMRLVECLVGDETGMIIFTARNDQGTGSSLNIIADTCENFYLCIVFLLFCCVIIRSLL